jgi:hypothetical protein
VRATEFLSEGRGYPCIVVDVQPEYVNYGGYKTDQVCKRVIRFVNEQHGPVLMFVNAEDQGLSKDTVASIQEYWDETLGYVETQDGEYESQIDWRRYKIVDKGFGYFRSWMDQGIDAAIIIKAIRLMYQEKVTDSSELFYGRVDSYEQGMKQLLGKDYLIGMNDPISVNWTSVAQLKQFNGAYLMGGGRDECLREVELLMNAFNIKYKRIESMVY